MRAALPDLSLRGLPDASRTPLASSKDRASLVTTGRSQRTMWICETLRVIPHPMRTRGSGGSRCSCPGGIGAARTRRVPSAARMVGIGHHHLVAGTRARAPPRRAAARTCGRSRHDRSGARRCRGREYQAPARPPAPRAHGRVLSPAAAGLRRQGTPPVRPDPVRAWSRSCPW